MLLFNALPDKDLRSPVISSSRSKFDGFLSLKVDEFAHRIFFPICSVTTGSPHRDKGLGLTGDVMTRTVVACKS